MLAPSVSPSGAHDNFLPFVQQEGRSPVRKWDRSISPKAPNSRAMGNAGAGGVPRRGGLSMSPGPRSHFAFQATTLMTGENLWWQRVAVCKRPYLERFVAD